MSIQDWLRNPENAETVAFGATLLCVWMAAEGAVRLPRSTPRLTTATALFALNWAVLLLFYLPGPPQDEILSAFSGFLLIYIGILLLREGKEAQPEPRAPLVGWLDTLPLHLFRMTVLGFGMYLLARRLLHIEYGYGMLAVALWGTLLTVIGYGLVWAGLTYLYQQSDACRRVAAGLGLLLIGYALCETVYIGWYARDYWPRYHAYQSLEAGHRSLDFGRPLPFAPRPDWPEYPAWSRLLSGPQRARTARLLSLKVEPRLPEMWLWLKYAFSVLKVGFTVVFLALLWCRPAPGGPRDQIATWLDACLSGWSPPGAPESPPA